MNFKERLQIKVIVLFLFYVNVLSKDLAFDKRVEQMLISACQKSYYKTVEMLKSA